MEFQRWWVLKSKFFSQAKHTQMKKSVDQRQFVKKCQNCNFKVNFWKTLLLKSCPIFDKPSPDEDTKFGNFIWLQLIFGQKPWFWGPIQLARQKVNIHYRTVSSYVWIILFSNWRRILKCLFTFLFLLVLKKRWITVQDF